MRRFFSRVVGGAPALISGDATPDPNRANDTITVKYGKDEFVLSYTVNAVTGGTTTVGNLRKDCSERISAPEDRVSLICAGKNLKEDSATLASLGISTGAKILCMGSSAPIPAAPAVAADDAEKKRKKNKKKSGAKARGSGSGAVTPEIQKPVLTPMMKIDAVWDGIVVNLKPLTDEFMVAPPEDPAKRADMHRRLTETMMGELLKLDSVESNEGEVRARRKEVVKDIQRVLEGLDRALKGGQKEEGVKDFDLD